MPLTLLEDVGWVDRACAPATCRSSADCASDECGLNVWQSGECPVIARLAGRAPQDARRSDAACGGVECLIQWDDAGPWMCDILFCDGTADTDPAP